jgi:hypothetical protein
VPILEIFMKFNLVFDQTGDSIPFQTINSQTSDLLCYYVERLELKNLNNFVSSNSVGQSIQTCINDLHTIINKTNNFIYELLDYKIETYNDQEYLDQAVLNKLHADWVCSQSVLYDIDQKRKKYKSLQAELIHDSYPDNIRVPPLGDVLEKLGVKSVYNSINFKIHHLEHIFNNLNYESNTHEWIEFKNPAPKSILTNDNCNLKLKFNHLGRTLYQKYCTFDNDLEFNDENSYDQLLKFLTVNMEPPQTIPLSKEYVTWCNIHNKIPSGDYLNIANIVDLDRYLTSYRKIIYQNDLQKNNFSIQLL